MSDTPAELQAALAAVLAELAGVKARVAELEEVVRVRREADGGRRAVLECTELVLRGTSGQELAHLAADTGSAFLALTHPESTKGSPGIMMGFDKGTPQMRLLDPDGRLLTGLFGEAEGGVVAAFGPQGAPGALLRGRAGGGSLAVTDPAGQVRGALVYDETPGATAEPPAAAELILARSSGDPILKLRADDGGALMTLGPPGQPDALALVAREGGPAILLHGPEGVHSVSIVAAESMCEVCVHQGGVPDQGSQACLGAGAYGSSLVLRGPNGEKGMDLSALDQASSLTLHDETGEERMMLCHHFGSHTGFSLKGLSEHDGLRVLATQEVTSLEVISPADPETKILTALTTEKPITLVQKKRRPILMFGEGEQGGIVCAYGPSAENAGIATLSGGTITGSLVLASPDGTAQLTLDATDHGGRLMINNDLGFQRIAMGVYQEAAGLHLNNTGNVGVQAIATPSGGVVTVSDAEGRAVASLPEREEGGSSDSAGWGRLPDGF